MKTSNLVIAIAVTSLALGFTSCKKTESTTKDDIQTTIELSTDQAISDNLTEDANDVFLEAATDQGLTGEKPLDPFESMGILGCASVNVTPLMGFPKTILIDFGTGCTSQNGITRKGKINIILSDSLRRKGSTAVLTFDGYYVNDFKKEGIITWTNNSTASVKGWERKVENGKITAPTGKYWMHNGTKIVVQTAGYETPRNLLDDVFSITGSSTVTNSNNVTLTSEILDALQKKTICENISKGSIKTTGPNHSAVIDFGNGDCDRVATIAIDGGTPVSFFLR
ncbi:MAG: hypothetical protein ABIQ31_03490 [Ferruginibacter sp.]